MAFVSARPDGSPISSFHIPDLPAGPHDRTEPAVALLLKGRIILMRYFFQGDWLHGIKQALPTSTLEPQWLLAIQ